MFCYCSSLPALAHQNATEKLQRPSSAARGLRGRATTMVLIPVRVRTAGAEARDAKAEGTVERRLGLQEWAAVELQGEVKRWTGGPGVGDGAGGDDGKGEPRDLRLFTSSFVPNLKFGLFETSEVREGARACVRTHFENARQPHHRSRVFAIARASDLCNRRLTGRIDGDDRHRPPSTSWEAGRTAETRRRAAKVGRIRR